ncbi:hypothetical protein ACSBR1_042587 [Camellia fascicularis]
MGAGRFTLNISRVNGLVAIDTRIRSKAAGNGVQRFVLALYCIAFNNGFTGSIPSELDNCSLIEYLELSQNGFTGDIPESFGNLLNLRFINLNSNFMKGSIPESLFRIPHLDTVWLDVNELNGSIPLNVGNMSEISSLWLYGNQLSGTIPSSIGNCTKLVELYLNDNQFVGDLLESLNNLEELMYLDVSNNSLEGTIQLGLGSFEQMDTLVLSFNYFSSGIPPGLGNCSSLTQLAAVRCGLTGPIPPSLGQLTQLTLLYLCENRLSGRIPPELGNLKSLNDLQPYDNQLEGEIPSELGLLSELQNLFLFTNRLDGVSQFLLTEQGVSIPLILCLPATVLSPTRKDQLKNVLLLLRLLVYFDFPPYSICFGYLCVRCTRSPKSPVHRTNSAGAGNTPDADRWYSAGFCSRITPFASDVGFLATILMRILKNDFVKYAHDENCHAGDLGNITVGADDPSSGELFAACFVLPGQRNTSIRRRTHAVPDLLWCYCFLLHYVAPTCTL